MYVIDSNRQNTRQFLQRSGDRICVGNSSLTSVIKVIPFHIDIGCRTFIRGPDAEGDRMVIMELPSHPLWPCPPARGENGPDGEATGRHRWPGTGYVGRDVYFTIPRSSAKRAVKSDRGFRCDVCAIHNVSISPRARANWDRRPRVLYIHRPRATLDYICNSRTWQEPVTFTRYGARNSGNYNDHVVISRKCCRIDTRGL